MANITINTSSTQYQKLLTGLGALRTVLAPRIKVLRDLPRDRQKTWLQRDPLLRRTIIMARQLADIFDEELSE